jgi:hypothetical protein
MASIQIFEYHTDLAVLLTEYLHIFEFARPPRPSPASCNETNLICPYYDSSYMSTVDLISNRFSLSHSYILKYNDCNIFLLGPPEEIST